jgi:hypothetical protein
MSNRPELHFTGPPELVSVMLPAKIALDASHEVVVGREVPAGVVLDSPAQSLMISRSHARISCTHNGQWSIQDLQSTNGTQVNGLKVSHAGLQGGDVITFGGAKSTALNQRPGPNAKQSIYTYSFHGGMTYQQAEGVLEMCRTMPETEEVRLWAQFQKADNIVDGARARQDCKQRNRKRTGGISAPRDISSDEERPSGV